MQLPLRGDLQPCFGNGCLGDGVSSSMCVWGGMVRHVRNGEQLLRIRMGVCLAHSPVLDMFSHYQGVSTQETYIVFPQAQVNL